MDVIEPYLADLCYETRTAAKGNQTLDRSRSAHCRRGVTLPSLYIHLVCYRVRLLKEAVIVAKELSRRALIEEARNFCSAMSSQVISELFGVTDGKAVGTFIEHKFKQLLESKYVVETGNSASGIDLPSISTDIKTTSIKQPFKSASQNSIR